MKTKKLGLYIIIVLVLVIASGVMANQIRRRLFSTRPLPPATSAPDLTPTHTSIVQNTPLPSLTASPTLAPTATSTRAPVPISVSVPVTYMVQPGDTLSGIAWDHDSSVDTLLDVNHLASDLILAGQVLTIPSGESAPVASVTQTLVLSDVITTTAPSLAAIEPTFITHGDRSQPYVALTFDACQTASALAGYDQDLINVLIETETPATLFLGGLWMQSHPTQTQALAANPLFELGNHSWSHLDFSELSPADISREILLTQDMMYTLVGRQPTLFRLPFGTYNDMALQVIAQHGLRTIQWDVVTGDPDPNISAEDITGIVVREVQNGSIVIMHMNGRGWHTAEALPTLILEVRAKGYVFVTVSRILGLENHADND